MSWWLVFCADFDGDGFSGLEGDCDDLDNSIYPGAEEFDNGADDNCNGQSDEDTFDELVDTTQVSPLAVSTNALVRGQSENETGNEDWYTLNVIQDGDYLIKGCGAWGTYFVEVLNSNHVPVSRNIAPFTTVGCNFTRFTVIEPGEYFIKVTYSRPEQAQGYELQVMSDSYDLDPDWAEFGIAVEPSSFDPSWLDLHIDLSDRLKLGLEREADTVRLWVSNGGLVTEKIDYNEMPIRIAVANNSSESGLQRGQRYQVLAQLLKEGMPVTSFSQGHEFVFEPAFDASMVSAAHSGSWVDADHGGQGLVLNVLNSTTAVVYWFTYNIRGEQRWYVGAGRIEGENIFFDRLHEVRNGSFDHSDPQAVPYIDIGRAQLRFSGCDYATFNYQINNTDGPFKVKGLNGSHQLHRLTAVLGHECHADAPGPFEAVSGGWVDPLINGEGWVVQRIAGDLWVVYWFTYLPSGTPVWFVGTSQSVGSTLVFPRMYATFGPRFGPGAALEEYQEFDYGSLTLDLGCETGSYEFDALDELADDGFVSDASGELVRLNRVWGTECTPQ